MHSKDRSIHKIESAYMKHYEAHQERQLRRRKKLIRRLLAVAVIVLVITSVMGSYHLKQRKTYAEKKAEYEQLQEELTQLKKEEQRYLEEISLLKNDEYVLDIARTNYFFSKDGELIFKIIEENSSY